jgi:hypothetical protein
MLTAGAIPERRRRPSRASLTTETAGAERERWFLMRWTCGMNRISADDPEVYRAPANAELEFLEMVECFFTYRRNVERVHGFDARRPVTQGVRPCRAVSCFRLLVVTPKGRSAM